MELTEEQLAQVAYLRDITGVPVEELSDEDAWKLIVEEGSVEEAAARLWTKKAATYAGLVDVTEGASSRKLSQLHDQALEMATRLSEGSGATGAIRTSTVRPIVRD